MISRKFISSYTWSDLFVIAGLALIYAFVAKAFLSFAITGGNLTLIFPPSGIALGFVLVFGRRVWPGVLVGAIAANIWVGDTVPLAMVIAIGSTLQVVVAYHLLITNGFKVRLDRLDDYFKIILWGGAISCIVAASVGVVALIMWGMAGWSSFIHLFLKWWMGDLLGVVLITPAILIWRSKPDWFSKPEMRLEAVLIPLLAFIYGQVTFLNNFTEIFGSYPKGFWLAPFVFFSAIRLRRHGASLVMLMITAQASMGAYQHVGFFANDFAETGLVNVWTYCMIYSVIGMSLAVLLKEQAMLMKKLKHQASKDFLTGVENRGHFIELAEKELARAIRYRSELSILMMDIDHFKTINDTFGHKVGDLALKQLSDRCKRTLREIDIVGRIGGEEFAVLLPETTKGVATEVAERIRLAIENSPINIEGAESIKLHISIGVATLVSADNNIDDLMHIADTALYEAKNSGRNRVCVASQ